MLKTGPKPELLSPAGNWECARAAVANGADAIYFGLPAFNARIRADNFTEADLGPLMRFLHEHGVKGYLAFNILVFTQELEEAEQYLRRAAEAEVDALIVQDVGLVRLARAVAPSVAVHASTQMTITSPEGVRFAEELGIERVVVARELSLREMAKFRAAEGEGLPLEMFVHGALCVAYSGQCLTSESMGQRSANRGECAQACRLPYQMVVDGELRDLGDRHYLLSPQDLAAVNEIPNLIDLGVESFKIEGRLKSPEYVAAVCQVYRKAIDAAVADRESYTVSPVDRYKLEMTFSRGLYSGWLHGVNHQELVHGRFGTKRGPFVGTIDRVGPDFLELDTGIELKAGDGVVFDNGGNTDAQTGGRVFSVSGRRYYFQKERVNLRRVKPGDRLWKTSDPHLEKELRRSFSGEIPPAAQGIELSVVGEIGKPLRVTAHGDGCEAVAESEAILEPARGSGLTREQIESHLGRLGGTAYRLESLRVSLADPVFIPVSELNRLRRTLVDALDAGRKDQGQVSKVPVTTAGLADFLTRIKPVEMPAEPVVPKLSVLCRTMDQIDASLAAGVETIYVDFEDIRRYASAVELVRKSGGSRIFLATPRIQKAGEQGFFKLIEKAEPDGVLIRNLGGLAYFRESDLQKVGDFSLNVANPLTAEYLMAGGFDYLTVSYDLNADQVEALLEASPAGWFELTLHQHMPMFHMEHCVYAAFLSNGKSYLDCGRPCEKHQIRLRDRVGVEHPVKVDVGCRNTVYQAKAQTGAGHLAGFVQRGLDRVRLELVDDDRDRAAFLIATYQAFLSGRLTAAELVDRLKVQAQLGVTSGTLQVIR